MCRTVSVELFREGGLCFLNVYTDLSEEEGSCF
jgi:hypothetical protein